MAVSVSVDYINPYIIASSSVLRDACSIEAKLGKPYRRETDFTAEQFLIMVGITGAMTGQIIFCFPNQVAIDIASKMCMMQLAELDDLAKSAVGELCNMILGNTATIFSTKGIAIDITPPTMCTGNVSFNHNYAVNMCIPLNYEGGKAIEINIAVKSD